MYVSTVFSCQMLYLPYTDLWTVTNLVTFEFFHKRSLFISLEENLRDFSLNKSDPSGTGLSLWKIRHEIAKDKTLSHKANPQDKHLTLSLTVSIISMLFNANGERTPYKSISSSWAGKKIVKTFCLVLLNEEMALLKLVTLRSEESSPSSAAAILAINSSGSGRHLGANRNVTHF